MSWNQAILSVSLQKFKKKSLRSKVNYGKTRKTAKAQEKQPKQCRQKIRIRVKGLSISVCWTARQPILWRQQNDRCGHCRTNSYCQRAARTIQFCVLRISTANRANNLRFALIKRFIDILNPTGKTIDALKTLTLPAGVDIKIKAA